MNLLIIQIIFCIIGLSTAVPTGYSGEYGSKYGGDIVLTARQASLLGVGPSTGVTGQTGTVNLTARWPKINNTVVVPYIINSRFDSNSQAVIMSGIRTIQDNTCVRFVARTNQTDYIYIIEDVGCWSSIGRIGGRQLLSIDSRSCMRNGRVVHELIHALGFMHMHQHPDRDTRIVINWSNIYPNALKNFAKLSANYFSSFNTSFDMKSIMHYGPYVFTTNYLPTITAKFESNAAYMGQRTFISQGDIKRINRMYSCPTTTTTPIDT